MSSFRSVFWSIAGFAVVLVILPTGARAQDAEQCRLPELRAELEKRVERDQALRQKLMAGMNKGGTVAQPDIKLMTELHNVDAENTEWLQQQIEQHGWLGKTLVGTQGAHHAWLLVQHADAQPKFQRECLERMNKMPEGEVAGVDLAYLTDRVLAASGKPQRYGTQVDLVDGEPVLKNVEDEANLDKRRAELGLGPMEEYLDLIRKTLNAAQPNESSATETGDKRARGIRHSSQTETAGKLLPCPRHPTATEPPLRLSSYLS